MLRWFYSLAAVAAVSIPAFAQNPAFTVRWYGQSFFTVTTPSGKVIAFDPHVMREFERREPVKADFVCVSHPHNDHNRVEEGIADAADPKKVTVFQGMKVDPEKPNRPAEWNRIDEKVKVGDKEYRFRTFGCYHDESGGMLRGKNSAFVVEADGLTFCHLGDLGHVLTETEAKIIGKVDVLFVPVGGTYTINGSEAKEVVATIQPRLYVIPMHYSFDGQPDTLLSAEEFLDGRLKVNKLTQTNQFVIPVNTTADAASVVELGWKSADPGKDK